MIKILSSIFPKLRVSNTVGMKYEVLIAERGKEEVLIQSNKLPVIREFTDRFSMPKNLVGTGLMLDVCNHKKAKHGLPEDWEFSRIWDEMDLHYMELRWYTVEINE